MIVSYVAVLLDIYKNIIMDIFGDGSSGLYAFSINVNLSL